MRFEDRNDWDFYRNTDDSIGILFEGETIYTIDGEAIRDAGIETEPNYEIKFWIVNNWKHEILERIEEIKEGR